MKIFCGEIRKTERIVIFEKQIQFFMPKKGYLQLFGIQTLLIEYSNYIQSSKSDQISNRIPLFGTQLFEYSNISNYLFKLWQWQGHSLYTSADIEIDFTVSLQIALKQEKLLNLIIFSFAPSLKQFIKSKEIGEP